MIITAEPDYYILQVGKSFFWINSLSTFFNSIRPLNCYYWLWKYIVVNPKNATLGLFRSNEHLSMIQNYSNVQYKAYLKLMDCRREEPGWWLLAQAMVVDCWVLDSYTHHHNHCSLD